VSDGLFNGTLSKCSIIISNVIYKIVMGPRSMTGKDGRMKKRGEMTVGRIEVSG
jgi:hypothetical protein